MEGEVEGRPLQRLRTVTPGRSCIACARRKIKCDRAQPCGYCNRLHAQCRYPDFEIRDKLNHMPDDAVNARLRRIEILLRRLQDSVSAKEQPQSASSADKPVVDTTPEVYSPSRPSHATLPLGGKLVAGRQDSRFTSGGFWTELDDENPGENSDGPADPGTQLADTTSSSMPEANSILFSSLSMVGGSTGLPALEQLFSLWQLFIDRVDPLLKILHVPTTQRQIFRAGSALTEEDPSFTSLLFAVCYAATSSIRTGLASESDTALIRYQHGLQAALSRAEFLSKPTLHSLQALVLFLICARHHADRTYIWSMTGLTTRLAVKLGLHQDPTSHEMAPLVTEMQRRLWWQIVILDVLTAEENDMDPAIHEHTFDTKMPSNFNDQDLDGSMTTPPSPSGGRTEMIFALQRIAISYAARKILFSAKFVMDNGYEILSVEQKTDFIDDLQRMLHEKYYRHCDPQIPLCALTTTASRLVLSRMKLTVASSRRSGDPSPSPSNLMMSCIHIVEGIQYLHAHELHEKWIWLFQRYVEWDAVAILLSCLTKSDSGGSEQVWSLIDKFWASWSHRVPPGSIRRRWHRLESLRKKAQAKRDDERSSMGHERSWDILGQPATFANPVEAFRRGTIGADLSRVGTTYLSPQSTAHMLASRQAEHMAPSNLASATSALDTQQIPQPMPWDWEVDAAMTMDSSWNMGLDEFNLSGW